LTARYESIHLPEKSCSDDEPDRARIGRDTDKADFPRLYTALKGWLRDCCCRDVDHVRGIELQNLLAAG
jgi:hypothetical protein